MAPKMSNQKKGTILGIALAAAASILLGSGATPVPGFGGERLEERVEHLEQSHAADSVTLKHVYEDVHYIRGRMDSFIDNTRTK